MFMYEKLLVSNNPLVFGGGFTVIFMDVVCVC